MEGVRKLNIVNLLKRSFSFYKENALALYKLVIYNLLRYYASLCIALYALYKAICYYGEQLQNEFSIGTFRMLSNIPTIILILTIIFFWRFIKVTIIETYYINEGIKGNILSIKETKENVKGLWWEYFKVFFLFGLITAIPAIIIGQQPNLPQEYSFIIVKIAQVVVLLLSVRFGFATTIRIIRPRITKCFSYNKYLIKNNFGRVFIVLLITKISSILIPNYQTFEIGNIIVIGVGLILCEILVTPFLKALIIMMIDDLESNIDGEEKDICCI